MLWLDEVGWWLIHSAVFGAIILLLGGLAIWVCREPVYRIRIIHWTFVACLLVPLLQQTNVIPNYSLNLWRETGSSKPPSIIPNQTFESSAITSVPPYDTEVAIFEPPPFDAVTPQREAVSPALQSKTPEANGFHYFPIIFRALQIIYLTLVATLFFTWNVGFIRRSMIAKYAEPANAALLETLAAIAGPRSQNTRLLVSNHVGSPLMWGVWRPTIVIPSEFATEENSRQLRWCLAHEWSHVVRRDFSTLLLANLAKFVCFYQPLYWWLRRQLMLSQDFLADAFAANYGESPEDYASFLVSLARDRSQPKLVGTLGIRDRRSNLLQRINALVKSTRPVLQHEKRLPAFAIILSALLLVGGLSVVGLSAAPPNDQPTAIADTTEKKPAKKAEQQTEKKAAPLDAKSKSQAKNENTKELPKPITYNGKVVDRKTGQPIVGATVEVKHQLSRDPKTGEWITLQTTTHKSDEQGNYRFTLPSEEVAQRSLYLEVDAHHPQYQSMGSGGYAHSMILKNLENGDPPFFETIKLLAGKEISATVLKPDGSPAANTRVVTYSKSPPDDSKLRYELGAFQNSQTDENGRFRIVVATPGDGVVWVFPKNFSPLAHRIGDQRGDIGPLKLQKGTRLRGQVLDVKGKPVANVAVNFRRLGDGKTVDEFLHANAVANSIATGTQTDKDGRFELNPLPPGKYKAKVSDYVSDYSENNAWRKRLKVEDVFVPFDVTIRKGEPNDPIKIRAVPYLLVRGRFFNSQGQPRSGHKQHLMGRINGQFTFVSSTLPKKDGWFEFKVPRGIEETKLNLMTNEHGALRWRLKPSDPLTFNNSIELGKLEEDLTTLEIVRYTAPILLLKAVDESGKQISDFKISSKYTMRPKTEMKFQYTNGGDVSFEKQADKRWRSSQLIPDQEITISIEKAGFTTKPQTVTLKEGEVRELVFVLKKTD